MLPSPEQERKSNPGRKFPAWGLPQAPLLPRVLVDAWHDETIPEWVASDLGLPHPASFTALGPMALSRPAPERVLRYLTVLANSRSDSIRPLPAVGRPWPSALTFTAIPWRRRTKNCLIRHALHHRLAELPYLTFGQLLDKRSMGMVSILDFACTLEAAISQADEELEPRTDNSEIEVPEAVISALEEPWAHLVSERDPRFAGLFPPGAGTLAERIEQIVSNPIETQHDAEVLATAIGQIGSRVKDLQSQPLDVAAMRLLELVGGVDGERSRALAARLLWNGESEPKTLEDAGRLVGLTRERIRQLEVRFRRRFPPHPVLLPSLEKALDLLASKAPIETTLASRLLQSAGLTRVAFHPASVIAIAKTCGWAPSIEVQEVLGKSMVVDQPIAAKAKEVLTVAQRQANACGATNLNEVAAELSSGDVEIEEQSLREVLTKYSGAEFLEGNWFWFPHNLTDAASTITRKALSVTSPLEIGLLRDAIRRAFQFRQSLARRKGRLLTVPPKSVLLAYYRAHPHFVVLEGGLVRAHRPLDYRVELGGIEQVLVDVIRSAPSNILQRKELAEACQERGVNLNSLWTMASYSPVLFSLGSGLWTLRGNRVDPAAVEALRRANLEKPKQQRILDHGWTPEGQLWIATRLPPQFQSKYFGIPGAVKRFLADRDFDAKTDDGSPCGRIRVYDYGISMGYARFLARAGADEGDIMLARFDLVREAVHLSLITDEQLDELIPE